MGINIKNPETQRLIRELTEITGETQTAAVTIAVRERIDRVRPDSQGRLQRMIDIADRVAPRLKDLPDIDSYLYDEQTGLPK